MDRDAGRRKSDGADQAVPRHVLAQLFAQQRQHRYADCFASVPTWHKAAALHHVCIGCGWRSRCRYAGICTAPEISSHRIEVLHALAAEDRLEGLGVRAKPAAEGISLQEV